MKRHEAPLLAQDRLKETQALGERLTLLRQGHRLRQAEVAARAGMARSTAVLIEKGDPGRTLAQVVRYLHAIAPQVSLTDLLTLDLELLLARAQGVQRVRDLSKRELDALNF